ncbi:isoleucine--tRNA ligase [Parachlamydia sp. AcF125]|uniref:isoleucine--tRNA ligase n=1 Tax=Parachlamydia sp. AcF125 TaxID=2795736 RepID=UPI001BC905E4|nr:isoleucine--tRNA ligase [Parachlamydia sp. AcF125]MBS4168545.1 Isoleucine--tRNA ligase [Parachlamydia sp. AcF125]
MLEPVGSESFDEREKKVLNFWEKENIFMRSIQEREEAPLFSFYDGPPFATGLPHYGHLLAGTIKDVVPRYKTMKGFCVPRRFGWDCHGLPIENEIEKSQGLSGAASIEAFGIANFNEECRKIVLRYTEEWKKTVMRMGRWVDFSNTYRTMDVSFMESVWWVFKQLYEKGLVYEGFKVMPFSAKLGTPLSNFEAGENYKEVDDPSLTVAFPLENEPNTSLLIWTTTPWTLVSNLAILAGPEIDYVKIQDHASGKYYILAQPNLPRNFKEETSYTVVQQMKGKDLIGLRYIPAFSYFADRAQTGAFRVIEEGSVSTEEGTGLVHCAPAFGEVDFYAAQRAGIEIVCPVNTNGLFTAEIPEYEGLFVKDADKDIIKRLKGEGKIFQHGTIHHRYPFCWRSDTPLIYRAMSTWFVAVEKIKDNLLASNREIHWTPSHIQFGRFGKWLEGARDWAISRNRYWGTPIPIWRAEDGELIVIGSMAELEKEAGHKITDLHRHFIDDLLLERNGKVFKRVPEVFDCWFESGSMPYAQNHYPFENRELFEGNFPADFIAEGLDQTRGWFYTLTILSTALFEQPAFKNVIVNGIILAEDGAKMSKRLRNYPDPTSVVEKFGADAVRLYMMHSAAVRGEDLCFSEKGVELVLRQILIPMWNAYSFFVTYARIYDWRPSAKEELKPEAVIDQWLLSLLNKLVLQVEEGMDAYDLSAAVEPFVKFVDQLTNWYIRRSRRRFWQEEANQDRHQAFSTLYHTLLTLAKIAAPFIPFITESIYSNLRREDMPISVHLCAYPVYQKKLRNQELEKGMEAVQTVVSLGHALRKEHKLKVRQPLAAVHLACPDEPILHFLIDQQHLIAEELNVKKVEFSSNETEWVSLKAKPNFRVLGKKVGKLMKAAQQAIDTFTQAQLAELLEGKSLAVMLEGKELWVTNEDVQVERSVHSGMIAANEGMLTVALDTILTEPLLIEGLAREVINKVNTMRREAGFAVTDRICIQLETTERVKECFVQHGAYIHGEVLALQVDFLDKVDGQEWDLNGEKTKINLIKM